MWSLFTCYVVPDSLWPHVLQHIRFLCIPLPPGVCSNICPLSQWWCHSLSPTSSFALNLSSIRVFSNESAFHIRWPKYWSFSISPSNQCSGLIFFRIDWFDLFAGQGSLKSLLQHHSSKASILQHSAFFIVPKSHPHMTNRKTIVLTRGTFAGKGWCLCFLICCLRLA